MKIGAIGIRTKIIVGDAATWHLVKKYIDGKIIDLATDYETLNNKPKINDVELSGNKTSEDLGLVSAVEGKSLVDDLEIAKLAGIEENANNYTHPETHPSSILDVVDMANGAANKFLNERGEMVAVAHEGLTDKNSEADFQHVDTTTTKPTLDASDMVAIKDSVTGKMVLTPKSNFNADNLIAEYVHSGNKEVHCTAVDLATGTFTSVGHGLVNGIMQINPVLNKNVSGVYPLQIFPTGLIPGTLLLAVINKTDNTFQVSADGTNPLTFTAQGDLTKWHFEKIVNTSVSFTNLNEKQIRVVINGGFGRPNLVFINVNDITANYIRTGQTSITGGLSGSWFTNIPDGNNIYLMSKIEVFAGNYGVSIYAQSSKKNINTAQPAQIVTVDETFNIFNPQLIGDITKISITNGYPNNGTEIKIYSI